jgi:hypothetical protein
MENHPFPCVRLRASHAKRGGFATHDSPCWILELVGIDGNVKKLGSMYDTENYFNHIEATNEAEEWAKITGWPIVNVKEVRTIITTLEVEK